MTRKSKPPVVLYSALADTTRCRILEILKLAPTPVHVLTEAFSISRPAISRHLRVLKSAGLVAEVKKGRENVYAFKPSRLASASSWLEEIAGAAPASHTAAEVSPPVATAPVAVAAPVAEPRPAKARKVIFKAEKTAAEVKPEPAPPSSSQMGFDF